MSIVYRYEFKYTFENMLFEHIHNNVLKHPEMFREIYSERSIHNIYLDDVGLRNYHDNLAGVKDRVKHRIRWYNNEFEAVNPTLEYKHKKDLLGWKKSFKMPDFTVNSMFCWDEYLQLLPSAFKSCGSNTTVVDEIMCEQPTLFNSYRRRYYVSVCGRFRVTIDFDLTYTTIEKKFYRGLCHPDNRIIMELKFDQQHYKDLK